MSSNVKEKALVIEAVKNHIGNSVSVAAAEYRGLSVEEITRLRTNARKQNVFLKVVPNTLAKLAFKETEYEPISSYLTGPIILAFAYSEPNSPARLFREFLKTNEVLAVKVFVIKGQIYEAKHLNAIADLPSRPEAIAKLMGTMKQVIARFVTTMQMPVAKFVNTVKAVQEKK